MIPIKEQTSQELKETKGLYEGNKSQINVEYNRRLNEFKTKEKKLGREKVNIENLINKIYKVFPKVTEFLKMESLCILIGFATDQTNGKMSLNIDNQPHNDWFD